MSMWTLCTAGPGDVRAFDFSPPTFKPGIQCSRNGGPPVIWNISLHLFVIIIVKVFFTVISITHFRNIIWGWTVPLNKLCVSQVYADYTQSYFNGKFTTNTSSNTKIDILFTVIDIWQPHRNTRTYCRMFNGNTSKS